MPKRSKNVEAFNFTLTKEGRLLLLKLSHKNNRSYSNMLDFLVKEEAKRQDVK